MPGRSGARDLDDDAVRDFAATNARLTLALRGFFHPAAGRDLLWNPGQAARLRPLVASIPEAGRRQIVERVLDRYEERVLPRWDFLPAQVVHGDFTLDNVLVDEGGRVSGITDFGDLGFGTRAGDLAIDLCSILRVGGEEPFRTARIAIDGYQSRIPLEDEELDLLGDLVFARLAALVAISAWRVERYPENAEYIQSWDDESWALLEQFDDLGFDDVAHELGASRVAATGELLQRRSQVLGSALTGLTYREPVHVVRGEGVWLFDAQGRRLLDCYNNVPVVGHCHPRVTEAVVRQTRLLNTHSRYLYEPLVELAERLVATMPPETGLDAVMLVNSGSEANDLAWRLATTATGHRGAIVTEFAYHGVTTAIADFSPEEWPQGFKPEHVETIAPPGAGREVDVAGAAARLDAAGFGLAATYLGLRLHERRHLDSCCRGGAGDRARDARGRRPGRRRRGAGGPRAERGAPVVVRAVRHRAGRRHAREADGERLPGRRGDRAPGALRPAEGGDGGLLDVRREPGRGAGCAGGAGRHRGRAARRAREAGGGGAASRRCAIWSIGEVRGRGLLVGVRARDRRS